MKMVTESRKIFFNDLYNASNKSEDGHSKREVAWVENQIPMDQKNFRTFPGHFNSCVPGQSGKFHFPRTAIICKVLHDVWEP